MRRVYREPSSRQRTCFSIYHTRHATTDTATGTMSLFGFNQTRPIRTPSTHQGDVRVKKRYSTRSKPRSGREEGDDVYTVSEVSDNVKPMKEAEKLTPSVSKDLVAGQTKGLETLSDFLKRITTIEEVLSRMERKFDSLVCQIEQRFTAIEEVVRRMEQKFDSLVCQIEQRKEEDGVVVSAQKDVIDRWKQEAGALVTTLRQVIVEKTTNCEVQSPCVPSATVGAVEKDTGNWGSVLAASSVQAVERSKPEEKAEKVDTPKPKSKPRNKENVDKVVQTVERSKPEAEASPNPLWILLLALYLATPLCVFSVTRYRVYSADYDPR